MATTRFRVDVAQEEDIPCLAALIVPTFAHYTVEILNGHIDQPEAIHAAGQRHLRAWREHKEETGEECGVKCMATDPVTGEETMAACAYWLIFPNPRSRQQTEQTMYLLSAEWISDDPETKEKAQRAMKPTLDARKKWLSGRGHAVLMYMATDRGWRRQGAATAVVRWGLDRCRELNIPAYLEASTEGAPVYERLGFERVEYVAMEIDGEELSFPAMMWWPPGTMEDEKRPCIN